MKTAFTLQPGERIWRGDSRPALIVPPGHYGIVCSGCEFWTTAPVTEIAAELTRVTHVKSCHGDELAAGRMTLHLAEFYGAAS